MNNDIDEIQQDFEALQYRHKHFWNVMIKLLI